MNQQDYSAFVLSRFKTPEATKADIIEKVSPQALAMFHAVTGILGEAVEYVSSVTEENMREELGDMTFFIDAALQTGEFPPFDFPQVPKPGVHLYGEAKAALLSAAADIVDLSKREVFYAKTLNPEQQLTRAMAFAAVLGTFNLIVQFHGYTIEQLRTENEAKLMKRYEEGFTNEAAVERADKKEGEA